MFQRLYAMLALVIVLLAGSACAGQTPPAAPTAPASPQPAGEPTPVAAPAEPADLVPLVYLWGTGTQAGCLLGAAEGDTWLAADSAAPRLSGGEEYQLYTLSGLVGTGTGTPPEQNPAGPCAHIHWVTIAEADPDRAVVAVGSTLEPLPRPVEVLAPDNETYRQVVADILREQGILEPEVIITQAVGADLEGDGVDEILLTATRLSQPGLPIVEAGDYSMLLMLKQIEGQIEPFLVDAQVYLGDAEQVTPYTYEITSILDANGDGSMEVMVAANYYEGSIATLYRVVGTRLEAVLGCGCGL
jgi:hypothetical protein